MKTPSNDLQNQKQTEEQREYFRKERIREYARMAIHKYKDTLLRLLKE